MSVPRGIWWRSWATGGHHHRPARRRASPVWASTRRRRCSRIRLFLAALFVLASGITLLQVAANPYVTILGPSDTAASRLNLTQAFNSLGTTVGPFLGSMFILSAAVSAGAAVDTAKEIQTVQGPYLILAGLLFLIAIVFSQFKLPVVKGTDATTAGGDDHNVPSVWKALAPGARRGGHLHVRGRRSCDRQLAGELHVPAGSGRAHREDRRQLSVAVLGRRHGRPVHRRGRAS